MKCGLFISFLFLFLRSLAQELPPQTQEQMENLADTREDDQFLLQLEYFKKHPLDLNLVSKEELQQLLVLTELQLDYFFRYRKVLGKLLSIYELQAVPLWDLVTIRKLLPYVFVGPATSINENLMSRWKGNHSMMLRLGRMIEPAKGYLSDSGNHYLGDRNQLLFRYRYQYRDLFYFGLVADKDAGEQFFRGAQSAGFDFYSFHFFIKKLGIIKSLAIGDFTVNMGQGLVQWQSFGFGKGSETIAVKRQSAVLLPYRAAGEYNFYRGTGVSLQKGPIEVTVFGSYKKVSGNIVSDTTGSFSSFQTSGYNRTPSEIKDRNRIAETSFGGTAIYRDGSFHLGVNAVFHYFDVQIKKPEEPYNRFALSGSGLRNYSIDHGYSYRNLHFFGEAAIDKNGSRAVVEGAIISVDKKIDLAFFYRDINMAYQSIYSSAFTESSSPSNERGIYAGISVKPANRWTINAYSDFYSFPWLRYRLNAPAAGMDYLFIILYQPDRRTELFARFRHENKPLNAELKAIAYPEAQTRMSMRIHYSCQVSSSMLFRWRVEVNWLGKRGNQEEGFLGFIETVRQVKKKIKFICRFQYAETGGYDSRIYAYESDVLYGFSIPAFYGKSVRYYLVVNYELDKKITLSARLARTWSRGPEGFGSGLEEIGGDKKTEIKIQLLVRL